MTTSVTESPSTSLADAQAAYFAEWRASRTSTPEEIASFYRDNETAAGDLAAWHALPERQAWTEAIVEFARERGVGSVLDVGCGDGTDLAAIMQATGIHSAIGVEPNDALAAIADERKYAGNIYRTLGDVNGDYRSDLTLCVDVLEHVPDPAAYLDRILAHVPVGGALVEHTPVWDIQNPSHLPANRGWQPDGQLRRNGFRLLRSFGDLRFWERFVEADRVAPSASLLYVAYRSIEPETHRRMLDLSQRGGWNFGSQTNDALVQRARSLLVSRWWREDPGDAALMVDADITFTVADAEKLIARVREGYDVICAAYTVRGGQHLACRPMPGTSIRFRPDAEPVEIEYGATGFLAFSRRAIDAMWERLPILNAGSRDMMWKPLFDTRYRVHDNGDGELLSEDWAFCELARECGFPVYVDPSIRLGHLGTYEYTLNDVVMNHQGKQYWSDIQIGEPGRE